MPELKITPPPMPEPRWPWSGHERPYEDSFSASQLAARDAQWIERVSPLVEAMPDLASVITWLAGGCDPAEAAKELRIYREKIKSALAAIQEQTA